MKAKLKNKSFLFKVICIVLFFFLLFIYVRLHFRISLERKDLQYKSPGLVLDTSGCKIPKLDPFDKHVRHLITTMKPYVCKGDPVFLVVLPNNTVDIDSDILNTSYGLFADNVTCSYKGIYRLKERQGNLRENSYKFGNPKPLRFRELLDEEFIKVECKLGSGSAKNYSQFLPLVPIKPEVEKRALETAKLKGVDSLNVILIGIDSVSKLNFLRHFNKTRSFLERNMSAFDMRGYTKVGDNTFPNLVPMLTGHFVEHYWNESVKNEMFFDNLDFIWKSYANRGYRTFYTEDNPYYGTFQHLKRGFENPPTDYYFRPMALAMYNWKSNTYCLNNQLETDILYGYLKHFVKTMQDKLFFSFTMVSVLTHDRLNDAGYCDEPTYNLLKELWTMGSMEKSMVVIFSDHGLRFGEIRKTYVGKIEERMPFMYIALPKWFLEKYKNISTNLETNQNRLITLFDVHATLNHLLDVTKAPSVTTSNGLSLFKEIPEYRTCKMANILPHWCTCQVYNYVRANESAVVNAAAEIVNEINEQLKDNRQVCAELKVDEITDARLGEVSDTVLRFLNHHNTVVNRYVEYGDKALGLADYLITLRTSPGGAVFEGTVRHDMIQDSYVVLGISRINIYGTQSACIESPAMKKFCFCK